MHVSINIEQSRTYEKTGWFSGFWHEQWCVVCKIIFTEEEKLALSKYDASFILYSMKAEYVDTSMTLDMSVPDFVRRAAGKEGYINCSPSQAQAGSYANRLRSEILPRLKDLTTRAPFKSDTFEL